MSYDLKELPHKNDFLQVNSELDNLIIGNNPYLSELLNGNNAYYLDQNTATKKASLGEEILKPEPSELRISTMTAVCNINVIINLSILYENIKLNLDPSPFNKENQVLSCQFSNFPIKGLSSTKKKRVKNTVKKNCFQNQATLIINLQEERRINLKIFRNGKVQMTGLKSQEEGTQACNILIKLILDMKSVLPDLVIDYYNPENKIPFISDLKIVLINSDYSAGFKMKRDKLHEILFNKNIYVSYEPDIYPGVNAKFYWNKSKKNNDGICNCKSECTGKGDGNGDGKCKKITIATFQSGNVIITGARDFSQTKDAYNFINSVFSENFNEIVRSVDTIKDDKKKKYNTIKVPIVVIRNWNIRDELIKINV